MNFGHEIDEAVEMAQSALGLALYNQDHHPEATNPRDISLDNENDFVLAITLDLSEYRRKKSF
nr:hypothetical protein [Enterococcus sp. 5B3_DIV0040]